MGNSNIKQNGNGTPEEKKGCQSPKKKKISKKMISVQEALQIKLNEDIIIEDSSGKKKKVPCVMAIAEAIVRGCLESDGPTRRLFLRDDILKLQIKEPEFEIDGREEENRTELSNLLVDLLNDRTRK